MTPVSTSSNAEPPFKIFALSIDESVKWASLDLQPLPGKKRGFTALSGSPGMGELRLPEQWPPGLAFEDWLSTSLSAVKKANGAAFEGRQRIGVSCIGPIEYSHIKGSGSGQRKRLVALHRKSWPSKSGAILDFNRLLEGFFSKDINLGSQSLNVRNDATAKALAESEMTENNEYPFVYINLDEGMNCGVIMSTGELPTALHPEFGHSHPVLHMEENNLDVDHTGCEMHIVCYEGLASGRRIRKQWGTDSPPDFIRDLDSDRSRQARTILSWYVTQACFTIVTLIAPRKIVIGGRLACGEIVRLVRDGIKDLNHGYIRYDEFRNNRDFIGLSQINPGKIDILGAVSLAYFRRGAFSLIQGSDLRTTS